MGFAEDLERDGWAWASPLPEGVLEALARASEGAGPFQRVQALAPLMEALAGSGLEREVEGLLGPGARARRAFLMDKREGDNWEIAFHQDTTFAVAEPREVEGFHAWVHKGTWYHVQAPGNLVAMVLSTRIHLDEVGERGGALKVLPGTHLEGVLEDVIRMARISEGNPQVLPARRGDVLLMRPLLLHGSERAHVPSRRRVLHVEWAAFELPGGLRWAWV